MRYLVLLALPFALAAQTPEPDQKLTQVLIAEIRQLRVAIERSTLLNARTQLAISQLQMQETAAARLSSQLNDVRGANFARQAAHLTEAIKEREQKRAAPQFAAPQDRDRLEMEISNMKLELEDTTAREQQRSARESELALQLQNAQNQVADSRSRIAEMEKALDAAIQQLLKQK